MCVLLLALTLVALLPSVARGADPLTTVAQQATDDATLADTADTAEAITIEATEPVVQTVEPVVQTVEPVVQTVEPVVQTVEPVVQTVEPVVQTVEPVVQTVEPVVEPVVESIAEPVQAVAEEASPVVEPIVAIAQPVTDAIAATAATAEPVTAIAEPVLDATTPVVNSVEVVAVPVTDQVKGATAAVSLPAPAEGITPRQPSTWMVLIDDVASGTDPTAAGPTEAQRSPVPMGAPAMPALPALPAFQPDSSDSQRATPGVAARPLLVLEVAISSDALIHSTGTALAGLAVLLFVALAHPAHGDGRLLSATVIWRPTRSIRPPTPHG